MLADEIMHQLSDTEKWQPPIRPLKGPASLAAHPRGLGAECHTVADAGGRHGGSVLGWCYLGITALWCSKACNDGARFEIKPFPHCMYLKKV